MIKVYGMPNCMLCDSIIKKIQESNIGYVYTKDEKTTTDIAINLNNDGKLIETKAPIVIIDGAQIKHKDLDNILKGGI